MFANNHAIHGAALGVALYLGGRVFNIEAITPQMAALVGAGGAVYMYTYGHQLPFVESGMPAGAY